MAYTNSTNTPFLPINAPGQFMVSPFPQFTQYTSIQAAITAAGTPSSSNPVTVWIWPGTYTENLTLVPYVNLAGATDPSATTGVVISGNAVFPDPSSGDFSITNVSFSSPNSSPAISFQSTAACTVHLQAVFINANAGVGLECTGSGMTLQFSVGSIVASSGGSCMNITNGFIEFFCGLSNFVDTPSTISGGVVRLVSCDLVDSFAVTGGTLEMAETILQSGDTLPCIASTDPGGALISNCALGSGDGYLVSGTGNLLYGNIVPLSSANTFQNTLNFIPLPTLSGNISFDGGSTFLNSDGQVWIGSGSGVPAPATLTAGSGIGITNAANSITISSSAVSTVNVQTFTASGTYTPTASTSYLTVECIGGGAGGGQAIASSGNVAISGGGGSGGYVKKTFAIGAISAPVTVTIGAGGANATNGGDTTFGDYLTATGGTTGSADTADPSGATGTGGAAGVGSGGDINAGGSPGTLGVGITALGSFTSGTGGSSFFGGGAAAVVGSATTNGNDGVSYGAGGGGAIAVAGIGFPAIATGGNGIDGLVVVTEYIS